MRKEDLEHYSKDELIDLIVTTFNKLKVKGETSMKEYRKSPDNDILYYDSISGGVLLTQVNQLRAIVKLSKLKHEERRRTKLQ